MKFCRSSFWNMTLTWHTNHPHFTQCFEDTVLTGIPCLILWLGFPFWLGWICKQDQRPPQRTKIYTLITKLIGTLILVGCTFYKIFATYQLYQNVFPGDIVGPTVLLLSYFLNGISIIIERRLDIHSSVILFYFWFLHFLMSIPVLIKEILIFVGSIESDFTRYNGCEGISDHHYSGNKDQDPESKSSHLSNLLWSWMDRIIYKGYKQPLVQDDVPINPDHINVSKNIQDFDRNFNKSQRKAGISMINKKDDDDSIVSILPVVLRTYGVRIIFSIILSIFKTLITFVNPVLLGLLIDHVKEKYDEEEWKGYFFLAILFFSNIFRSIFHAFCDQQMCIVNIQMESTLTSAIYKKSMRLSNKARSKYTIGEITNYMSVDATRIRADTISNFITTPLTTFISLYWLYNELGWAGFGGIIIILVVIPVGIFCSKIVAKLEEEFLKDRDVRTKLMNEVLAGMKVLKLYAWEIPLMNRVQDARKKEMSAFPRYGRVIALQIFAANISPFLITSTVFMIFVFTDPLNHILDAKKIFVSISILTIFKGSFEGLPWIVVETIKIFASLRRINKFLNAEEMNPDMIGDQIENKENIIEIENASFLAGSGTTEQLKNIHLEIKSGSLTAIVGEVGCGKSLLLESILGETDKTIGSIQIKGKNDLNIAYVPQQVWIQNLTLKNNILFNNSVNNMEYDRIIEACALKTDLEILPAGDNTEIGESGINLSGGQKQRIGIARAVYSNADLYLLDDPLSAVDAHVGKHLFENVLHSKTGLLKDKTRVIATNSLNILQDVDQIIVLDEGVISEQGTYEELMKNEGKFSEYLKQYLKNGEDDSAIEEPVDDEQHNFNPRSISRTISATTNAKTTDSKLFKRSVSHGSASSSADLKKSKKWQLAQRSISIKSNGSSILDELVNEQKKVGVKQNVEEEDEAGRLIEEEEAQVGTVKYGVYLHYFKAFGWFSFFVYSVIDIFGKIFGALARVQLSEWSEFNEKNNGTEVANNLTYYLGIYSVFEFVSAILVFFEVILLFTFIGKASTKIHENLLYSVMRSPMSFFDTNPTGRIINRFTSDIETIDHSIPWCTIVMFPVFLEMIKNFAVISYSTHEFLYIIIPVFIIYVFLQRCYVKSSRQLQRLESISKSPILSHFIESVNGASTIRAFGQTKQFIGDSQTKIGASVGNQYYNFAASRWFSIRIENVANLVIFFAALFAILNRQTLSPGMAGLSISYAMTITSVLNEIVNMFCDAENNSVALERVLEYTNDNPQEASWKSDPKFEPEKDWPQEGKVQLLNYETQYREGLELVLKGITMEIGKETKIGICGRTGAGKSSLTLALFRIIEPVSGSIIVDGHDISKMGLHDLRSRLTIIPQDPILFTGSIRFNLDPTGVHNNDESLWNALEQSSLKEHFENLGEGLEYEITEGGSNFSLGQKQLICLARAILRKTKILVLDEATAAIDMETDEMIQKTIRISFKDCTVITIAHRLNTIIDSDAIAVLSNGILIEYDKPDNLLNDQTSAFRSMFNDTLAHKNVDE